MNLILYTSLECMCSDMLCELALAAVLVRHENLSLTRVAQAGVGGIVSLS